MKAHLVARSPRSSSTTRAILRRRQTGESAPDALTRCLTCHAALSGFGFGCNAERCNPSALWLGIPRRQTREKLGRKGRMPLPLPFAQTTRQLAGHAESPTDRSDRPHAQHSTMYRPHRCALHPRRSGRYRQPPIIVGHGQGRSKPLDACPAWIVAGVTWPRPVHPVELSK